MHFRWHLAFFSTAIAAPLLQVDHDATVVQGQYIVKLKQDVATVYTMALKQSLSTAPMFEYSLAEFHGFAGFLSNTELAKLQASDQVYSSHLLH